MSLPLSMEKSPEDYWGYPVPVSIFKAGRSPLAKYAIIRTNLRKLYQANHNRFYTVAVEVFCDRPGLPRAGSHDDFEVGFVMRRLAVRYSSDRKSVRQLATTLVRESAVRDGWQSDTTAETMQTDADVRDFWWSTTAADTFAAENAEVIAAAQPRTTRQAWVVPAAGPGRWRDVSSHELAEGEQPFPMWRLPRREKDCPAVDSRSLWFGVIPTYSSEHTVDPFLKAKGPEPKLDDHGIYELVCFVKLNAKPGHEHCPPKIWLSSASEPFRLASPMDPEGTKNRVTSIALPDFRAMAARAADADTRGPGGLRIVTPPQSQMLLNPFSGKMPTKDDATIGIGGGVCTFAIELFFIVAFFLFLLFMPIVVLAFQLWWMLALRFCFPPSVSFDALATAAVGAGLDATGKLELDVMFGAAGTGTDPNTGNSVPAQTSPAGDAWYSHLETGLGGAGAVKQPLGAIIEAENPSTASQSDPVENSPSLTDPLCEG